MLLFVWRKFKVSLGAFRLRESLDKVLGTSRDQAAEVAKFHNDLRNALAAIEVGHHFFWEAGRGPERGLSRLIPHPVRDLARRGCFLTSSSVKLPMCSYDKRSSLLD